MSTINNRHLVEPYLFFNGRCEEAVDFHKNPKYLLLLAAALAALVSAGCNTIRGAGRDVENTGHAIERAVR